MNLDSYGMGLAKIGAKKAPAGAGASDQVTAEYAGAMGCRPIQLKGYRRRASFHLHQQI
jgi:hypothetical protein